MQNLKQLRIFVCKGHRKLEVFEGDELKSAYAIVIGFEPVGAKEVEGDGKTPEGEFCVFAKNSKSKFHLSLGLSYPGADAARRGLDAGLITESDHDLIAAADEMQKMPPQKTALGGEIYIHGGGTCGDWTDGCLALNNDNMTELFDLVPVGTRVTIVP